MLVFDPPSSRETICYCAVFHNHAFRARPSGTSGTFPSQPWEIDFAHPDKVFLANHNPKPEKFTTIIAHQRCGHHNAILMTPRRRRRARVGIYNLNCSTAVVVTSRGIQVENQILLAMYTSKQNKPARTRKKEKK